MLSSDNFELEKAIRNFNKSSSGTGISPELMDLLKVSRLIMPVLMDENSVKNGDFDINYIKIGAERQAVALFTSEEKMQESGIRSSFITLGMDDLAETLSGMENKYAVIAVNPVTGCALNISTESFLNLFEKS